MFATRAAAAQQPLSAAPLPAPASVPAAGCDHSRAEHVICDHRCRTYPGARPIPSWHTLPLGLRWAHQMHLHLLTACRLANAWPFLRPMPVLCLLDGHPLPLSSCVQGHRLDNELAWGRLWPAAKAGELPIAHAGGCPCEAIRCCCRCCFSGAAAAVDCSCLRAAEGTARLQQALSMVQPTGIPIVTSGANLGLPASSNCQAAPCARPALQLQCWPVRRASTSRWTLQPPCRGPTACFKRPGWRRSVTGGRSCCRCHALTALHAACCGMAGAPRPAFHSHMPAARCIGCGPHIAGGAQPPHFNPSRACGPRVWHGMQPGERSLAMQLPFAPRWRPTAPLSAPLHSSVDAHQAPCGPRIGAGKGHCCR